MHPVLVDSNKFLIFRSLWMLKSRVTKGTHKHLLDKECTKTFSLMCNLFYNSLLAKYVHLHYGIRSNSSTDAQSDSLPLCSEETFCRSTQFAETWSQEFRYLIQMNCHQGRVFLLLKPANNAYLVFPEVPA